MISFTALIYSCPNQIDADNQCFSKLKIIGNELPRSLLRGINGKAAIRSQQAAGNVPVAIHPAMDDLFIA